MGAPFLSSDTIVAAVSPHFAWEYSTLDVTSEELQLVSQQCSQTSYLLNHTNIVAIGSDSRSIYTVHRTCWTDLGSEEPLVSVHRRNLVDGGWREEPRALGLQAVQIPEPPIAGQQQGLFSA